MRTAQVDVTLDDIAHGEKMDCVRCPIARAVWRLYPAALDVVVSPQRIDILFRPEEPPQDQHDSTRLLRGIPPAEAYIFMTKFDGGHAVSPFSFEITLYSHCTYVPPRRAIL
jgi:hypothetical protein